MAVLSIISLAVGTKSPVPRAPAAVLTASAGVPVILTAMPCGPRELPEGNSCVPLPSLQPDSDETEDENALRGRPSTGNVIPRKPDRPRDPAQFLLPIEGELLVLSGFDDAADAGEHPLAVELGVARGAAVRALTLDGQVGPTEVAGVGRWVGTTVVTRHTIQAERPRVILLFHGHLDAVAPGLKVDSKLPQGEVLGFAGDSGQPGVVSLFLEARLVREGAVLSTAEPRALAEPAVAAATDLRNVLARKP